MLFRSIYGVGVFKSVDGGANWTDISSGLTNPFVLALALDSQTPASLYAGTYGDGVFALTMTPPVTLTVATTGDGAGTVTSAPQGIACGADCSASYSSGATVTLTADAASSSVFTGWSGCDRVADTSCTVTMNASRSVTAGFKLPRHWGRGGGPRRHSR